MLETVLTTSPSTLRCPLSDKQPSRKSTSTPEPKSISNSQPPNNPGSQQLTEPTVTPPLSLLSLTTTEPNHLPLEHGALDSATTTAFLIRTTTTISSIGSGRISTAMRTLRRTSPTTGRMILIPRERGHVGVRIVHQYISKSCNGPMDGWCLRVRIGRMVGGGL